MKYLINREEFLKKSIKKIDEYKNIESCKSTLPINDTESLKIVTTADKSTQTE